MRSNGSIEMLERQAATEALWYAVTEKIVQGGALLTLLGYLGLNLKLFLIGAAVLGFCVAFDVLLARLGLTPGS